MAQMMLDEQLSVKLYNFAQEKQQIIHTGSKLHKLLRDSLSRRSAFQDFFGTLESMHAHIVKGQTDVTRQVDDELNIIIRTMDQLKCMLTTSMKDVLEIEAELCSQFDQFDEKVGEIVFTFIRAEKWLTEISDRVQSLLDCIIGRDNTFKVLMEKVTKADECIRQELLKCRSNKSKEYMLLLTNHLSTFTEAACKIQDDHNVSLAINTDLRLKLYNERVNLRRIKEQLQTVVSGSAEEKLTEDLMDQLLVNATLQLELDFLKTSNQQEAFKYQTKIELLQKQLDDCRGECIEKQQRLLNCQKENELLRKEVFHHYDMMEDD